MADERKQDGMQAQQKSSQGKIKITAVVFVAIVVIGACLLTWPELRRIFAGTTVRELSENFDSYVEQRIRVRGTVTLLEPYPFGIGNVENVLMRIEDEGASIELIYDRLSASYQPRIGDRVLATGVIMDYGPPPRRFIGTDVEAVD